MHNIRRLNAISLYQSYVFISDPLNHALKRINISDGSVTSTVIPDTLGIAYDIVCYENKVLCTSNNGFLMSFDLNLNFINGVKVSIGWGKFAKIKSDTLQAFFPSDNFKLITINSRLKVLSSKIQLVSFKDSHHGRKLIISDKGSKISTDFGSFYLDKMYSPLEHGGLNIDYSGDSIVFFSLDTLSDKLVLSVCNP